MNVRQLATAARDNVVKEMKASDSYSIDWQDGVQISEMIGEDAGAQEFLEKVTLDLYQGREQVELVYTRIYNKTSDANLPKTLDLDELGPIQVVFLQHVEGGEVAFGAMAPGTGKTVKINTWAAGLQYTEDFVEFNQTWRATENAVAFGEAYNKLMNHLHMGPIVTFDGYVTTAGGVAAQKAAQKAGTPQLVTFDTDIATTFRKARRILPKGSLLIVNSLDTESILDAVKSDFYADGKTPTTLNRAFNQDSFLEYETTEAQVGDTTYTYDGVEAGECFLIVPKSRNFREYEKHDLRLDSDNADLSRLILEQLVGRTRRGVLAGLGGEDGVIKIELS
jgi:hypothetical protein